MALLPIANLDTDLTTVSTEYPVLAAGTYQFKVASAICGPNKTQTGHTLTIEATLEAPAYDNNGNAVMPGYKMTHRTGLTVTEKYDNLAIAKYLATLQDAILGTRVPLAQFDTDLLIGQTFTATTKIAPEQNGYAEKAEFGKFIKKG